MPRAPSLAALALSLAGSVATGSAAAAEWRHVPSVVLVAGADTNVHLRRGDERYSSRSSLSVASETVGRGARFQARFKPEVRSLRYDDPRELDRDDAFVAAGIATINTRGAWSLGASYARESTLTSEFEGTGFVEVDVERRQSGLDTTWSRQTGARGSVSVSAAALDVDYEEAFLSPLVDYGYRSLRTAYSLATTERSRWQANLGGSRVVSSVFDTVTDSVSLDVSWSHVFSPGLSGTFGVGAFDVSSSGPFGADSSGTSASFRIDREWPLWSLRAAGERELRPDGRGILVSEDAVEVGAARRLRGRVTLTTSLRRARTGVEGSSRLLAERDYAQLGVALQWRMTPYWSLHAALLGRAQSALGEPAASGRQGVLSVGYRGG